MNSIGASPKAYRQARIADVGSDEELEMRSPCGLSRLAQATEVFRHSIRVARWNFFGSPRQYLVGSATVHLPAELQFQLLERGKNLAVDLFEQRRVAWKPLRIELLHFANQLLDIEVHLRRTRLQIAAQLGKIAKPLAVGAFESPDCGGVRRASNRTRQVAPIHCAVAATAFESSWDAVASQAIHAALSLCALLAWLALLALLTALALLP